MIFHRSIAISNASIDDSPYRLFDSITLYTLEELAAMDADERDPGDIENDEIADSESAASDTNLSGVADSPFVPDESETGTDETADDEETEHDAPIGHPEGYVAPVDDPAPVYNPDDEEG